MRICVGETLIVATETMNGKEAESNKRAHKLSLQAESSERGEILSTPDLLVSRLKTVKDDGVWSEFFEAYCPLIYATAKSRGLRHQEREEVLQETMVAVARHIHEFESDPLRCSFKTWLLRITNSKIIDQVRKRRPTEELDEGNLPWVNPELESAWLQEWQERIAEEAIRRVRSRINPLHFTAFCCVTLQGRSPEETAHLVQRTTPWVHLSNFRVKHLLRAEAKKLESAPL